MIPYETLLDILNRLADERPQINFDSYTARQEIARVIAEWQNLQCNYQLALDDE
jgi:hypothetical protein